MADFNWWLHLLTAIVPLLVGAVYYNPKVVGGAWMKVNGFTEKDIEGGNMAVIFGLSYVAGILISLMLGFMVIHQLSVYSILMDEPGFEEEGSALMTYLGDFMSNYGGNFRGFSHGVTHGASTALLFVAPIFLINALFERRGFKYVLIHAGYWVITLALMGGILAAYF